MSRTFRKERKTSKKVRDGRPQYVSKSCEHHGGCPWSSLVRMHYKFDSC